VVMMAKLAAVAALALASIHGARIPQQTRPEDGAQTGAEEASVAALEAGEQSGAEEASVAALGGPNVSIVNGRPASRCEWIWQVSMEIGGSGSSSSHWCGGMLIDSRWVLTAAHCLGGADYVRAGSYIRDSNEGQRVRVAQKIGHPRYNSGNYDYDFALLRLSSSVRMGSCVGTVSLPQQGRDVAPGTTCWITGWGTTSSNGPLATRLQEVQVDTLSNTACKRTGYSNSQIKPSMLCAQGRNSQGVTDACQADSGGPLVCQSGGRYRVFGATSWGRGCAAANYPGVWARVHYVLDWIGDYV